MQGKIIRESADFIMCTPIRAYMNAVRGAFSGRIRKSPCRATWFRSASWTKQKKRENLDEILPRTNSLIRPAVANVDQALVIFALVSPKPNFNLLDRFLVLMEKQGIPALICMNKTDLASDEMIAEVRERYRTSGYPLLFVSAAQKEGIEAIREYLRGKTTTVAGPSGVGKSSLINCCRMVYRCRQAQ